jgi:hypothetical protein
MTMQRGFGLGSESAPLPNQGDPLLGTSIFYVGSKEGQNRRTTILLDGEPVTGYRHKIKRPYIEGGSGQGGDWKERDIRVTCQNASSKEDQPRSCLICEQALRHGNIIKRHFTANLTCIDEGEHRSKKNNNVYYDLKKLLELDWTGYEALREQSKVLGSLAGMHFSVIRPSGDPKQSKTYGLWTPLTRVNVMQHFANSPAVRAILEHAMKRGERISHEQAVQRLVSPIDYSKELNNYSPANAERFLARALSTPFMGGGGGGGTSASFQNNPIGGGGFQPQPQPQYGGAQTISPHAAPDYSVAPQAQSQFPPPGAPQAPPGFPGGQPGPGMTQAGGPQWTPQGMPGFAGGSVPPPPQANPQNYQPQAFGPPPVGNPPGSTMPQNVGLPPQQPPYQPSLAPWAQQPTPGAPSPMQPQPMQPQNQPPQGYSFAPGQGWSSQFPGQAPAPAQAQPQPGYQHGYQPMPQPQAAPQMSQPIPQAAPPGYQPQPQPSVPTLPGKLPFA